MIRAVVFDMDGLMFDTERLCALAWDEAGRQLGIGPAGYMNRKTLGLALPMARKVWRETFGEKVDFDQLDRLTRAFFDRYYAKHGVPVKPGLHELLAYLKERHYKTAVASSTREDEVKSCLASGRRGRRTEDDAVFPVPDDLLRGRGRKARAGYLPYGLRGVGGASGGLHGAGGFTQRHPFRQPCRAKSSDDP